MKIPTFAAMLVLAAGMLCIYLGIRGWGAATPPMPSDMSPGAHTYGLE